MMKKRLLLLIVPLSIMLFFVLSANATLIESGLPGGGQSKLLQPGETQKTITPAEYINYLYLFVMGFVGIAGLVTLVIWGTVWTASGVVDKKAMAMEGIKNTLIGIGIALSAYVLLNTINPDLTRIKTPDLKINKNTQGKAAPGCELWASDAKKCQWTVVSNTNFLSNTLAQISSEVSLATCKNDLGPTAQLDTTNNRRCSGVQPSQAFCCYVPN